MTTAIVLDTETTGFSPDNDRIIELCIVRFETEEVLYHSYFNPGRPISEEITKITGITDEMVKDAPAFAVEAAQVADFIRGVDALIGHNPWFDRGMLAGEFRRAGVAINFPMLVCTKRMWDVYEPKESRHLTNAYKRFVDKGGFEGAHGARADTMACLKVLKKQREEFNLLDKKWSELDPEQTRWWGPSNHIVWNDGILTVNFGKNKNQPVHTVDKGFWRWVTNQDFPDHVKMIGDYMVVVATEKTTGAELASWAYGKSL